METAQDEFNATVAELVDLRPELSVDVAHLTTTASPTVTVIA